MVGQFKSPESALNIRGDKIGRLKFLAFTLPGALLTLHTTSDRSGRSHLGDHSSNVTKDMIGYIS